jgi:hypothetical protein
MTNVNKTLDIGFHERCSHGQMSAIGCNEIAMIAELFNVREQVVPAPAIQTLKRQNKAIETQEG